jgi:phage terminase large subunit GpA-like protein
MAVVEHKVACPACDEVVNVKIADDRSVVGAGHGHTEREDAVNQLCTSCMDAIHVVVA